MALQQPARLWLFTLAGGQLMTSNGIRTQLLGLITGLAVVVSILAVALTGVAPAKAAVVSGPDLTLSVDDHGQPFVMPPRTDLLKPGGAWTALVRNTGTEPSSGTTTLRIACQGLFCLVGGWLVNPSGDGWSCSDTPAYELTCTNDDVVPAGGSLPPLRVPVAPYRHNTVYATFSLNNPSDNNADDNQVYISSPVVDTIPAHLTLSVKDGGEPFVMPPRTDRYKSGGAWTALVRNTGTEPSSGTTTVRIACQGAFCLVGGWLVNPSGDGWSCSDTPAYELTCTNDQVVPAGGALPPLRVPVAPYRHGTVYATFSLDNPSDNSLEDNEVYFSGPVVDTIPAHLALSVTDGGKPFHLAPENAPYTPGGEWTALVRNTGTEPSSGTTTLHIGCQGIFCLVGGWLVTPSGDGWSCSDTPAYDLTCTNDQVVPAGGSLPPLRVPVAPYRHDTVYATFSLNNPSDNSLEDNEVYISSPVVSGDASDLVVNIADGGLFEAGGTAKYTITARNVGTSPAAGEVSVAYPTNLPSDGTDGAVSVVGDGWSCADGTCTRPGPVAGGAVLPPITVSGPIPNGWGPGSYTAYTNISSDGDGFTGNNQSIALQTNIVTPVHSDTALVTGLAARVSPETPMWNVDVAVSTKGVTCPATVTVRAGSASGSASLCATAQQTPQPSVTIHLPVYNRTTGAVILRPKTKYDLAAQLTDAVGPGTGATSTLTTPGPPQWVGVGDSYSAGHHQDADQPRCFLPLCYPASYSPNDVRFSWVTRAAALLNSRLRVPRIWRMTPNVIARSGALAKDFASSGPATDACTGCGEIDALKASLANFPGTWNVVSITGGANDVDFAGTLEVWYREQLFLALKPGAKPWAQTKRSNCPDTEGIYGRTLATSAAVTTALKNVVSVAKQASPTVRIVDVNYPYVMPNTNVCYPDRRNPDGMSRGIKSIIDQLATEHLSVNDSRLVHINLRSAFTPSSPLMFIQLTRYYGYPHPNNDGQDRIAGRAVTTLLNTLP
jgi:hypothetical protein